MLHGVEVVDDGAPPEIKEVLTAATIASPIPLPVVDTRQRMLNRYPLPQLSSPVRSELAFAQILQQAFVRMNVDTAAGGTGCAALPERADLALLFREVHGCIETEGDGLPCSSARSC
jgi:hypothetical protein